MNLKRMSKQFYGLPADQLLQMSFICSSAVFTSIKSFNSRALLIRKHQGPALFGWGVEYRNGKKIPAVYQQEYR